MRPPGVIVAPTPQRRRATRKAATTTATKTAMTTTTQIHSGPTIAPLLYLVGARRHDPGTPTGQRPSYRLRQGRTSSAGSGFMQRCRVGLGRGLVVVAPRLDPGRLQGTLLERVRVGLGQLDRASPGEQAWPTRQAGARGATPAAMDQQALDRVRGGVQGGLDGGQAIEALPLPLFSEGDLQDHAPAVLVPAQSTAPLVSAASTNASPWASLHRAAEGRPLNTSMDHHSMLATVPRPTPLN